MLTVKFHAPSEWSDCLDLAAGFDFRWGLLSVGVSLFGVGFNADLFW